MGHGGSLMFEQLNRMVLEHMAGFHHNRVSLYSMRKGMHLTSIHCFLKLGGGSTVFAIHARQAKRAFRTHVRRPLQETILLDPIWLTVDL